MQGRTATPNVHKFCRTQFFDAHTTSATGSGTIAVGQMTTFSTMVASHTEFTTLFDQYRIDKVEYTYAPRADSYDIGSAVNLPKYPQPRMAFVVDRDDAATPLTQEALGQYENCKIIPFTKPVKITYKPNVAGAVFAAGLFNGYANQVAGWIDMSSPGVEHYGHKIWINLFGSTYGTDFKVDLTVKVWFSCRNVR